MSIDKIIVNYEELKVISQYFGFEADYYDRLHIELTDKHNLLISSGWIGRSSDAYQKEMETSLLPSLSRLSKALRTAQEKTLQILQTYRSAENEASLYFTQSGESEAG